MRVCRAPPGGGSDKKKVAPGCQSRRQAKPAVGSDNWPAGIALISKAAHKCRRCPNPVRSPAGGALSCPFPVGLASQSDDLITMYCVDDPYIPANSIQRAVSSIIIVTAPQQEWRARGWDIPAHLKIESPPTKTRPLSYSTICFLGAREHLSNLSLSCKACGGEKARGENETSLWRQN